MRLARPKRVLVVGWDGADWRVITPLMEQGLMPNLSRLCEQGVMGNLASMEPMLSPMIWTSIATGKRPFKHRVLGFTEPTPDGGAVRPVTTLSRQTRALWNMLTLRGMQSNVVGWWPSHPAEPINGVMVSNHYAQAVARIDKPWPMRPGTVHPERLAEALATLRVHPEELDGGAVGAFVSQLSEIDQGRDHRVEMVGRAIAECASIQSVATALMQREPWDFMGVYFDSIDHFCHGFMAYRPPQTEHVSDEDYAHYKGVVDAGYRFHDMMLGAVLELAGDDTLVMVISDHGFESSELRQRPIPVEPAGPAAHHRMLGMFAAMGPGLKRDERLYGASVLDITPTVLHALGLPVGEDMDGHVLLSMFDEPGEIATISSWDDEEGEDGGHPEGAQQDPLEAREALDQLVALGYIDPLP